MWFSGQSPQEKKHPYRSKKRNDFEGIPTEALRTTLINQKNNIIVKQ